MAGPGKPGPAKGTKPAPNSHRPKGALDKRSKEAQAIYSEYVEKYGCPLEELFKLGFDKTKQPKDRISALRSAMSRGLPELKSVELSGSVDVPKTAVINLTVGAVTANGE